MQKAYIVESNDGVILIKRTKEMYGYYFIMSGPSLLNGNLIKIWSGKKLSNLCGLME